jgi:pyrimidine-nucleoside phosphorylase
MSKKIAEGIGGLVLDVKTGAGAFMKTPELARRLATSLVAIGRASGVRTEALITRMDAPLGRKVGNALEVIESLETLKGGGPADVEALSVLLAARMLILAGLETDEASASARVSAALRSGAGLEKLRQIVENQGGDPRALDDYRLLPSAPDREQIRAPRPGVVAAIHAGHVGDACVRLGAGRSRLDETIDHGVGIELLAPPGTDVRAGDTVFIVHHRGGRGLGDALALLDAAIVVDDASPAPRPLVLERITD